MSEKRHSTVEGTPSKKYRVYTSDSDGRLRELVAEYDTLEELKANRWRLDTRRAFPEAGCMSARELGS